MLHYKQIKQPVLQLPCPFSALWLDISQYNLTFLRVPSNNTMLYIIEPIILLFVLYSLVKIIRRKLTKPDYRNKTVWITGASSGIGEYLAYEFSKYGAHLILSARNIKELERVKSSCQNQQQVQVLKLDMSDYKQVEIVTEKVIRELESHGRRLDVVVENAGISMRCEFKDYDFQNHLSMFDVNVNGPYRHIQCFLSHMIKNKSGQIVGITSVQGKLATSYRSSYAASKHALVGILDSLRSELHEYGITVTNIMPGYVLTNISKNALGAQAGATFGQTDANIEKGMKADSFSREAVRAIFMKENEAQISNQPIVPIGIFIRNLCPDLSFLGLRLNTKNQTKAIKKAA